MNKFTASLILVLFVAAISLAQEHRVEVVKDSLPEALAEEVAAQLSPDGLRVVRGSNRTICEIWPCKKWPAKEEFKPTFEVQYPFQSGQLIGAMRFRRKSGDFRDQQISRGVYTLRYAQQPVDGNHVGTSPTRDFLVMLKASDDKSADPIPLEQLMEASAEAAGTSHPAMLCLKKLEPLADKTPSIHHDEDNDWWILRFSSPSGSAPQSKQLSIDLVVVGHADE